MGSSICGPAFTAPGFELPVGIRFDAGCNVASRLLVAYDDALLTPRQQLFQQPTDGTPLFGQSDRLRKRAVLDVLPELGPREGAELHHLRLAQDLQAERRRTSGASLFPAPSRLLCGFAREILSV